MRKETQLYYTIYKTINLLNNKIYIGKHQTKKINDSYLGSGIALNNAIKKHGRQTFKKVILFVFDSEDEMNDKEMEIVTESFISTDTNYNSAIGGKGGPHFKGKTHTDETKAKIGKWSTGKKWGSPSAETRKKIKEAALIREQRKRAARQK